MPRKRLGNITQSMNWKIRKPNFVVIGFVILTRPAMPGFKADLYLFILIILIPFFNLLVTGIQISDILQ